MSLSIYARIYPFVGIPSFLAYENGEETEGLLAKKSLKQKKKIEAIYSKP